MNFFSKITLRQTLKGYGVSPKKKFGQNFLIDKGVAKKILKTANLQPTDTVIEVGPGTGSLTGELAKKVKKVIAVEKDPEMILLLKKTVKNFKNVKIIQNDILKIRNWELGIGNSYKVVANLPYYIVSPAIRKFLEMKNPPKLMVLMVQKEVAQRICAKPPHMNLLAVSVQFYAKPEIISYVSKKSFWPIPKVDSAIIKIIPRHSAFGSASFRERFFRIAKAGFSHPRKQLLNNLSQNLKINRKKITIWLLQNKIKPYQRAESLSLSDWMRLVRAFTKAFH